MIKSVRAFMCMCRWQGCELQQWKRRIQYLDINDPVEHGLSGAICPNYLVSDPCLTSEREREGPLRENCRLVFRMLIIPGQMHLPCMYIPFGRFLLLVF